MSNVTFMDAWLHPDETEVLDAWQDTLHAISAPHPEPESSVEAKVMLEGFDFVREQGWMALALDPEVGHVLFAEALKRFHRPPVPIPVPLLEIWVAARMLRLVRSDAAAELLTATEGGGEGVVVAIGDLMKPADPAGEVVSAWVPFGDALPFLLPVRATDGVRLCLVPPGTGTREAAAHPDPTMPSVRVTLSTREIAALRVIGTLGARELERVRAEALAVQGSAMVGVAQGLLDVVLDYLRVREQFGVPIGSFQALQHRCADLVSELHVANLISGYVASLMVPDADLGPFGYMCKAFCGEAALRVASEAIQMHGGMGFTWESSVHLGFKRCSYLAMSGLSVGECEVALGEWAVDAAELHWSTAVT